MKTASWGREDIVLNNHPLNYYDLKGWVFIIDGNTQLAIYVYALGMIFLKEN